MNGRLTFLKLVGISIWGLFFSGTVLATGPQDEPFITLVQHWDQILPADDQENSCNSSRFTCVLPDATHPNGAAVRDNETGLVWELSPDLVTYDWSAAIDHCANREAGGRKGWHLPMREQLASLIDPLNNNPALPTGHPFLNVQSADFWSASTHVTDPSAAWDVRFGNGNIGPSNKIFILRAWCVRGGQAYDGQDVLNSMPSS